MLARPAISSLPSLSPCITQTQGSLLITAWATWIYKPPPHLRGIELGNLFSFLFFLLLKVEKPKSRFSCPSLCTSPCFRRFAQHFDTSLVLLFLEGRQASSYTPGCSAQRCLQTNQPTTIPTTGLPISAHLDTTIRGILDYTLRGMYSLPCFTGYSVH